jgi:D-arabinose 1-dehydrogenase-like Zn-dependent alcohol dehydrogenase
MAKSRAIQIPNPKGAFELVEGEIPEPGRGYVRIKVQACGVCHSDALTKEGLWPGIQYPRIPGHEVAGVIDAIGAGVEGWKIGQRAGTGWHGGHCGYCDSCSRGDFVLCQIAPKINGISVDGGYAEHMIVFAGALAKIPDEITAEEAAPLMCAGVTTFNSLRNSGAGPGDLVAVLGIGGLGHLGIQFAVKMGFRTIAIARGADKGPLSRQLGALQYIDSNAQNPAAELQKLGGAKIILATATNAHAMNATLGGLAMNGKLIVLGAAPEALEVPPILLISGRRSVAGWASGSAIDSQVTMAFSAITGIRSMNEVFPFTRAADAYERMMSGQARFRVVLKMEE